MIEGDARDEGALIRALDGWDAECAALELGGPLTGLAHEAQSAHIKVCQRNRSLACPMENH
jgi:hypothetical protein